MKFQRPGHAAVGLLGSPYWLGAVFLGRHVLGSLARLSVLIRTRVQVVVTEALLERNT